MLVFRNKDLQRWTWKLGFSHTKEKGVKFIKKIIISAFKVASYTTQEPEKLLQPFS